ncbi:flippase [Colwellia sp. M166]|uniref:flippase n=1 Tax=Colwellia sp. M166 TaxID=2583805 RepID=UPI00211EC86A|nr:flippase [Colwellia sp. M166]UUO23050.1 flippase [Colwellia sp. M166]
MIKAFFKDSLLYTFANLFTRGIGFILLPIYTRVLSKQEYGLFDYLTTIGLMLGVIMTLEITQAIYRFIPEYKGQPLQQVKLASTSFWFSLLMYSFLCVICFIFSNELSKILLDDAKYAELIKTTSILFLTNAILFNFSTLMRANLLSKQVVLVSTFNAIFVASFSLVLVVYLKLGLLGLIAGQLIGVSLSIIIALFFVKAWIKLVFCFKELKDMLSYSAPLVFSSIGVVLSMFVDRVMLKEFLGAEQLAPYAVAIKIASIATLLLIGFQSALTPLLYSHYKEKDTPEKVAKLFHLYLIISLFSVIILSILGSWLVKIVAGEQYVEAVNYVVPLVCAALFSSMYIFFPGLSIAKKTSIIAIVNVLVGLLNVILNYVFIPKFGALGASFSTLLSISIALLCNALLAQRFYKIPINYMLTLLIFSSIFCILIYSIPL